MIRYYAALLYALAALIIIAFLYLLLANALYNIQNGVNAAVTAMGGAPTNATGFDPNSWEAYVAPFANLASYAAAIAVAMILAVLMYSRRR